MPLGFSNRLLSVLQLTRMALVFTAIADSMAALLLWAKWRGGEEYLSYLNQSQIIAVALISVGLYGYGMSLNDIIDRRRDRQIAAHRPLPSGRIGLISAHVICVMLGLTALFAGAYLSGYPNAGILSVVLLIWTGGLITFYDFAGKYLVAPGLLTLGLIRFFHATIPAPQLPLVWHPLLLLNHVAIVSTVAYVWEEKRPTLTRIHWWAVLGGLAAVDAVCIGLIWGRRHGRMGTDFAESLWVTPGLFLETLQPATRSISALSSTNGSLRSAASRRPSVDLPAPRSPISATRAPAADPGPCPSPPRPPTGHCCRSPRSRPIEHLAQQQSFAVSGRSAAGPFHRDSAQRLGDPEQHQDRDTCRPRTRDSPCGARTRRPAPTGPDCVIPRCARSVAAARRGRRGTTLPRVVEPSADNVHAVPAAPRQA